MGFLFIFILLQMVVNFVLQLFIDTSSLYGIIAYYMLSSLIISFFAALMSTPKQYRKEFYKESAFHKTMLSYFLVFTIFDAVSILIQIL